MEKNVRVNIKTDLRCLKEFLELEAKLMNENSKNLNQNEHEDFSYNDDFSIDENNDLTLNEIDNDNNNSTNTNTISNRSNKQNQKETFMNINKDYIKFLTSIVKMYNLEFNSSEIPCKENNKEKDIKKDFKELKENKDEFNESVNFITSNKKRIVHSVPKSDHLHKKRIIDNLNMFSRDKIKYSIDLTKDNDNLVVLKDNRESKENNNNFLRHSEPKPLIGSKPQFYKNLNSDVSNI